MEIVRFGLAFHADLGALLGVLVHVVGDRAHVVEELAVDGPTLVLVPQPAADHLRAVSSDQITQLELLAFEKNVTESLVFLTIIISRFGS